MIRELLRCRSSFSGAAEEFSRAKRWYRERNPQTAVSHVRRRPGYWLR